jgi:hypothetical protein
LFTFVIEYIQFMEQQLLSWFENQHESSISGRYISLDHIKDLLPLYDAVKIGESVLGKPIYKITVGTGSKKILLWSQMHGNESTTTKALFDLLKLLKDPLYKSLQHQLLNNCTLLIIPILNPDGAAAYTRLNANGVDLNRDAKQLSQPESKVLRAVYDDFKPDFCFNLHGQRTIFSAGPYNKSASLSFLSPAFNEERALDASRRIGMEIIGNLNNVLQTMLPGNIGRYDDGFNANCVGDSFQALGTPTILFEAGHIKGDYSRDAVRKYIFYALVDCLYYIASNEVKGDHYKEYFDIPENEKLFFDIILRNVAVTQNNTTTVIDIAIQYKEVLEDSSLSFQPLVAKIGGLSRFFGHQEIDVKEAIFDSEGFSYPVLEQNAERITLNKQFLSVLLTKK